jgi:hypothetical protein
VLPTLRTVTDLVFGYCRPSKSSSHTLGPSGSVLGLAPSEHLSQIHGPPLLTQLLERKIVKQPIFSLILINGQEGVLSVGGTAAKAVDFVVERTKSALDRLATPSPAQLQGPKVNLPPLDFEKREDITRRAAHPVTNPDAWREKFKWAHVQGADGFWQILMQGVFVGSSKVLKDQPVVLDVNSPFTLAPPLAARTFYSSIPGALPLPVPQDRFYSFPCLNPPKLGFEFDAWRFPALQGGRMLRWDGPGGGWFSLGRVREGSGYCVGSVVETRMGEEKQDFVGAPGMVQQGAGGMAGRRGSGEIAGNGMRGVWVLGETWFRGVGAVFDFKEQTVGFRSY